MFDRRWSQLGEILVNYSTRTQAGDRLLITMMEPETFPLTLAVYEHAVRAGAFPQVQFASAYFERSPRAIPLSGTASTPDPPLTPPRGEGHLPNVCMTTPVQATLARRWMWVCACRTAWHSGASDREKEST